MSDAVPKKYGLKMLIQASSRITTRLELDRLLDQVVRTLTAELGGVYAIVWTVERDDACHNCERTDDCLDTDECLKLRAWDGPGRDDPAGQPGPVRVMRMKHIALARAPYLTDNIIGDDLLNDPAWVKGQGISSFAGFPLVCGDNLMGVLAFFGDIPLDPELCDILSCFAHQCAMAIEDARRHERLKQSEEHYKALLDGAIDSVLIVGMDGAVLNASRSASRQFGYSEEEVLMMNIRDLDLASESKLSSFFSALSSGGAITYETTFSTRSGEIIPVEVRAGAIPYGRATAIQAFVRDVSERKKLERQKSDLISMVTHDLKGPLSIIMGYAEVINSQYRSALPEFVAEGIEAMEKSAEKLLGMVEDYLSLSRMESGALQMMKEKVTLPALLNRATDTVVFKAEEKKLSLHIDCPPDTPPILADSRHLERAVVNLMMNAVNYTPRGGAVTLTGRVDEAQGVARITVADTGMGIPSAELTKVFDKYYRSAKTAGKGAGLGLAIVKRVVEGHGGSV